MVTYKKILKMSKQTAFIVFIFISNVSFSQVDYNEFKGEKSKISFTKAFTFANLYDYKVNAFHLDSLVVGQFDSNYSESILTKKYSEELSVNTDDVVAFTIVLYSKLSIDIQDIRHDFIKYKTNNEGEISEMKILVIVKNDNTWEENAVETKEINVLKEVLLNSDVDLLFEFYGSGDSSDYPEINALKPLTKDANGALIIEKLHQVLKDNQSSLSKYLDE